jgi:hypothetical protein
VRIITLVITAVALAGCASAPPRETYDLINAELAKAAKANAKPVQPDAVTAALLPPLQIEVPAPRPPLEERFGVTFNNIPAAQFFMALVAGTKYSMLVHPEVTGNISVNLKDVTLFEALDAVRELYGYDYSVEGTRIYVKPLSLQTRVFKVNYLTGNRKGSSDIRVTSGSVSDVTGGGRNVHRRQYDESAEPAEPTCRRQQCDCTECQQDYNYIQFRFLVRVESFIGSDCRQQRGAECGSQSAVRHYRRASNVGRIEKRQRLSESHTGFYRPAGDPGGEDTGSAAE